MNEKELKDEELNQEEEQSVIFKQPVRFGWIDFIINFVFSLIMIVSIYFFAYREKPEDISLWITSIFVTILPLLLFANRAFKEFVYTRDYIEIKGQTIRYRSSPLITTGLRTKKGEIQIREIKKFGLSKIPRKLSFDLFKHKKKAMLVISLKSGKEYFFGEYIENDDLAEICIYIKDIYPKAKLVTNLAEDYPDLANKQKKLASLKQKKAVEDDEDIEGAGYRKR